MCHQKLTYRVDGQYFFIVQYIRLYILSMKREHDSMELYTKKQRQWPSNLYVWRMYFIFFKAKWFREVLRWEIFRKTIWDLGQVFLADSQYWKKILRVFFSCFQWQKKLIFFKKKKKNRSVCTKKLHKIKLRKLIYDDFALKGVLRKTWIAGV